MSTNLEEDNLEPEDDDFNDDDFGFIIGADGELKSIIYPENLMEDPPECIQQILKIFGIDNINDDQTLH